jgi:DNA invertase Pin-like site-specific DNA recombinase
MSGAAVVTSAHLERRALVYLRQSGPAQVSRHPESTALQYALVERALALGWPRDRILVIDADLGLSGAGFAERGGFARVLSEVGTERVGIVLALDPSRLARNSVDWLRLVDLCAITDTLIGDADGVYRPNSFNDRLLLAHKGLISEAELHQMRIRLDAGIRNKAARGALRRRLPVGLVWRDGEIRFHPDLAVGAAIGAVFERFAVLGSARSVWRSLRAESRLFPQSAAGGAIRWIEPGSRAIRNVLTNPVYAGAYVYGRSRREVHRGADGRPRQRNRRLPREEWSVLIPGHHEGFIDWPTWEGNQHMLSSRMRARPAENGTALLAGLLRCGRCGRRLRARRGGTGGEYRCPRRSAGTAPGPCLAVAAPPLEAAVTAAVLAAPERNGDRRPLLCQRIAEIVVELLPGARRARLTLDWRDGRRGAIDIVLLRAPVRTDAATVALVRRLAAHYSDGFIAAILNREGQRTPRGHSFTARHVGSLRRHWRIPSFARPTGARSRQADCGSQGAHGPR